MKRTVSILLAFLMCVSLVPNVFAFTPETVESAAEAVEETANTSLTASNDSSILGDKYLADGLGKAIIYSSGESMNFDYLDPKYVTGNQMWDNGKGQGSIYEIKYSEAGTKADVVSDPKGSSKNVMKLTVNGSYAFGAMYFDPGQLKLQKGKYTGRVDMYLDAATGTPSFAFLYRTQVYNGSASGSDANSGLDINTLKNAGDYVTCTSATGSYDGSTYTYNGNLSGDSIRFLAYGVNGTAGTTTYVRDMYYYFYPANSFMIKDASGKLSLIELNEGDKYTFPEADGNYVSASNTFAPGDKVAVSELEYQTFTVSETLPDVTNDGKTPGLNIATGTQKPLTFDEETAAKPGLTGGATNSIGAFDVSDITGNEEGGNVFKVSVPTSQHYMSVYVENNIQAYRPYFYKFDIYSNHAATNACLWMINGNSGNGGDHISHQTAFEAAIKANKWFTASGTVNYKTDRTNVQIQVDSWWGNPVSGHEGTAYYYDNILVVPYYKVSYMYDGDAVETAYINACEDDGSFKTELALDLDKTIAIPGKKFVGWSLTNNSATADAPATVAAQNRDIRLYAVTKDADVVTVTYMNGDENLGSVDSNYNDLLTKAAFAQGKLFKGWSTTADGANIIDRVPENDVTLYAAFADVATETAYGTLVYYNDFSNTAMTEQQYTGWRYDDASQTDTQTYLFLDGNYKNDDILGATYTGATKNNRAIMAMVNDPAGSAANPVLQLTQSGNYPRFETYFTNKGAAEPSAAAGTYTITYKIYVPSATKSDSFRTAVNINNTQDTGTDWAGRFRAFTPTRDAWTTVTEQVEVPGDYERLGKLGFFSLSGNANGNLFYLDDYAIYFKPSVNVTFMNGETQVASVKGSVGSTLPLAFAQSNGQRFVGWSTDGTEQGIITVVPENDVTLYAVFEDLEFDGKLGTLLFYADFSYQAYKENLDTDNNEENAVADGIYDYYENARLSTRAWFATYESAYDPAGSGDLVLKVNKKADNSRPTVKFADPLTDAGFYTVTGRVFVPKGSGSTARLIAYADTPTDGSTGPNIWKYAINDDWSNFSKYTVSYTEGEWKEFSRTYRIPEDIESIGQIGLINSLNGTAGTYYIDDLAVWYSETAAPVVSNDVSVRADSITGIRFSASVSASLKASATEYGFIVTRKSILDTIGKTANDLKFDLTADGYTASQLYASGVAYKLDESGNVLVDKQYDIDAAGNTVYTAVCINIPKASYGESIVSRPYILIALNGKTITAYGKTVTSSLKEAAQSVKDAGGAAYEDNKTAIDDILNA